VICSFVIGCVVLIDKIYKKNYSRQWIYIIWAIIAIRLIIPVNLGMIEAPEAVNTNTTLEGFKASVEEISNNSYVVEKDSTEEVNNILSERKGMGKSSTPSTEVVQKANPTNMVNTTHFRVSILDTITVIWIVGFISFLLYHLTAYFYFKAKLRKWSITYKDDKILKEFQILCAELGITSKINLMTCKQVTSPILIGIVNPSIILPPQEFTLEQYRFILKHELIHYKHHDLLYKFILLLANAVHWFNPFVYYMAYLANNDIELYCDEKLIAGNGLSYRENYSKTILQIMTGTGKKNNVLLSTGFSSRKKQLKNRFYQIMNAKPSKKGVVFVVSMICLILVTGNVIAWFLPVKDVNADGKGIINSTEIITDIPNLVPDNVESSPDRLEEVSNVLVVGIDGPNTGGYLRADSILMISVNPGTKKVILTSFLRDMYLEIPQQGKHKLSLAYELGGTNLIKNALEENFGITIDHTMTINMKVFEDIINSIGGVKVTLTEKEATYLNTTNYITEKEYRNVVAGEQILNGNQALGYVRVRKVPTLQGEQNDLGRTMRLREVILSFIKDCSKKDIRILTRVAAEFISNVSVDISLDKIITYFNIVMQEDINTHTLTIPVKDSYNQKVEEGMNVLDIDLKENTKALEQIYQ